MSHFHIALPSAFLSLTLFLFGPSQLFFTNSKEFYFVYEEAVPYFIIASLIVFLITYGIAWLLSKLKNKIYFNIYLSLIFITGCLIWLQGNVLVWNYGLLTGKEINWDKFSYRYYIDAFVWVLLLCVAVFKYKFINKISKKLSALLIIIQLVYIVMLGLNAGQSGSYKKYVIEESNKFTFSKKNNVIFLLLDTLQSDIFYHVLSENTEYKKIYDGFKYYPNTMSSYPYTFLSVPSILTGSNYKNKEPIFEFLEKAYMDNSILTTLKKNGYRTEVYTGDPVTLHFDQRNMDNIVKRKRNLLNNNVAGGIAYLADVSLFRYSPSFVKKSIYNNQKWLLSNTKENLSESYKIGSFGQRSINFVKDLNIKTVGKDIKPVFKFYHLRAVHPPYELNRDLSLKQYETDIEGYKEQIRAMLTLTDSFLKKLKEQNVFDNSMIVILADHGAGYIMKNQSENMIIPNVVNENVQKKALPLLLVKPFNSRGELITDKTPVSLNDVSKTVADYLRLKNNMPGLNFMDIDNIDIGRTRVLLDYKLEEENFWTQDFFSSLTEYPVKGDVENLSSWSMPTKIYMANSKEKIIAIPTYELGKKISFNKDGNSQLYKLGGWSSSEDDLTWTNEQVATLRLSISHMPYKDLLLKVKGFPFRMQRLLIYIDKENIGEIYVNENKEYEIVIPKDIVKDKEIIYLSFVLPDAKYSPAELNIGKDPRKLGIAMEYIEISEKN